MILLYSHSGSFNHGCEALVRSIVKLFPNERFIIQSNNPDEDYKFGISEIATIVPLGKRFSELGKLHLLLARIVRVVFGTDILYWYGINKPVEKYLDNLSYAFSIGGDNYCYTVNGMLNYQNQYFQKKNIKTVLFGASINQNVLSKRILTDLRRYTLITARESETYNSLLLKGLDNVRSTVDSAYFLDKDPVELSQLDEQYNYIGINASPLLNNYESDKDIVYNSYIRLIKWILDNTDSNILLIPHVTINTNNDLTVLRKLYGEFNSERIIIISNDESLNCMQLKYVISKCEIVVAARTHVSIAAYSSNVPCLVVGYSIKSRGIAKDLFGTEKGYVVNCYDMKTGNELLYAFRELYNKREDERKKLSSIIPNYLKSYYEMPY